MVGGVVAQISAGRIEATRAESQWIVAARPLCHLQYPVAYLSRLQWILPIARWELRFKASRRASLPFKARQRHVPLKGGDPLLLVGKRTTGACVASSPDSDLEAFSHNPMHGSFAPLAFQPSAMTNCANQQFLSRIPLVRTSSESTVPPTADGFGTGTPVPSPQSQSFSRGYESILPTSLAYIVPSTRGCSPWRPDAVMSTTGRGRHSVLRIFNCRRGRTGHHATCGALPAARPYLWLSRFQGGQAIYTDERSARARAPGFAATAAPSYSSGPGPCPDGRSDERFSHQYRCGPPPEFPLASPRLGIVHHLSGPDRYALTRTLHRRSGSVDGATHKGIPPISFLAPYGFTRLLTRTHVRLLGPCFKTGRMGSPQAEARSA
ncbi:hypothetical protein Fmac_032994 [Flemingia macrophylla]|uniref:Uncharacterized protein n=1 Tax=Flemingia macrophylla TaxID=520843 RepID=A0ABD1L6Y1_9FABA